MRIFWQSCALHAESYAGEKKEEIYACEVVSSVCLCGYYVIGAQTCNMYQCNCVGNTCQGNTTTQI